MANMIDITQNNFDEIIAKHSLIVFDFWAQWCAPCQTFTTVIEEVSKDYSDFVFGKIDIDSNPELAEEFHVRSVPAVMIMRDNVIVFAESGAMPASNLRDLLDQTKSLTPDQLTKNTE